MGPNNYHNNQGRKSWIMKTLTTLKHAVNARKASYSQNISYSSGVDCFYYEVFSEVQEYSNDSLKLSYEYIDSTFLVMNTSVSDFAVLRNSKETSPIFNKTFIFTELNVSECNDLKTFYKLLDRF